MITLWLLLIIVLVYIIQFRYKHRKMYELASLIPTASDDLPIIGVAHRLMGTSEDIMSTMQKFSYETVKNNGLLKSWSKNNLILMVTNPEDSEKILKTCLEKTDFHNFMRHITGNGTLFAPVNIWKHRRKVLSHAFNPKLTEKFVQIFSSQADILVQRMSKYCGTGEFDVWHQINKIFLESILHSTIGVERLRQNPSYSPFLDAINCLSNMICERICHFWLHFDLLYSILPRYNLYKTYRKFVYDYIDKVIQDKRRLLKLKYEQKSGNIGIHVTENTEHKTFLDLLISISERKKGYNDLELREELIILIVAGTDTTALTVAYSLMLLGKFPEIQDKVYQELCDVFEDMNRPVILEDLIKLVYMEQVVKETLRLFPPGPFIMRKVESDLELPSGRVVPRNATAIISIWGIHRDSKYWGPDAESYDPDRFSAERFNEKQAQSFIPFSSGPRNCVASRYAMMSVKTTLAAVLKQYRVVTKPELGRIPNIRVKLEIMLKAVDGYKISLERRGF